MIRFNIRNLQANALWLCLLLMPAMAADARQAPFVVVGPLSEDLNDVGCAFTLRNAPPDARQIFKDSPDGAWMNLDGKDVLLTPVQQDYPRAVYRAGDIHVYLYYGYGKEGEGGVGYPRATLKLIRGKDRMTLKIAGGCGC